MNDFMQAASELGLEKDPTILALSQLLYASDRAFERHVDEQMAVCKRVGEQIDSVRAVSVVVEG